MNLFSVTFSLFLLMDSIGNIPLYVAILSNFPLKKQIWIITRESLIALVTILAFTFFGQIFLDFLGICHATIALSGGVILFLIAIKMIFPLPVPVLTGEGEEPFIFPLAIHLVAGPSVLAGVMIYSLKLPTKGMLVLGVVIAWVLTTLILLIAPWLGRVLGNKGCKALEKLMGLILVLIGIQMFLDGLLRFQSMSPSSTQSCTQTVQATTDLSTSGLLLKRHLSPSFNPLPEHQ